jgi:heme-degrading monooxygenase HmoA
VTACVLLFAHGAQAVPEAYHRISRSLAGTPGLVRNTLLALVDTPGRFVVLSEWTSLDAFRTWEQGPDHRQLTAPLRPYHEGFGVYEVAAEYRTGEAADD